MKSEPNQALLIFYFCILPLLLVIITVLKFKDLKTNIFLKGWFFKFQNVICFKKNSTFFFQTFSSILQSEEYGRLLSGSDIAKWVFFKFYLYEDIHSKFHLEQSKQA